MDDEALSRMAEEAILEMRDYTLNPEQFKEFFLEEVYGKPRPEVLPIVRSFTNDVDGVILQLHYFKNSLRKAHEKYMDERKKDERVERLIKKLVANIQKEAKSERQEGRCQRSLCEYTGDKKYTTRKNYHSSMEREFFSSKAAEGINEMTEDELNPLEFKKFFFQMASGKPKSKALPILRSFTRDISRVIGQLKNFRSFLREAHKNYMAEHVKDNNACNRIITLIKNIEKEQKREARQCKGQRSMGDYV